MIAVTGAQGRGELGVHAHIDTGTGGTATQLRFLVSTRPASGCTRRKRLDAARKRYAVLKRKLESEFQSLDSLESKVAELDSLRKVGAREGRGAHTRGGRCLDGLCVRSGGLQ